MLIPHLQTYLDNEFQIPLHYTPLRSFLRSRSLPATTELCCSPKHHLHRALQHFYHNSLRFHQLARRFKPTIISSRIRSRYVPLPLPSPSKLPLTQTQVSLKPSPPLPRGNSPSSRPQILPSIIQALTIRLSTLHQRGNGHLEILLPIIISQIRY